MLAATSYCAKGRVIRRAIDDINKLRAYVVEKFGPLEMCLLEGHSMGGNICTHVAEIDGHLFQGALLCGAALLTVGDPPETPLPFEHAPTVPLLYLSNYGDCVRNIEEYIKQCEQNALRDSKIVVPALWTVARTGHNDHTEEECASATSALIHWIEKGEIEKRKDATINAKRDPSLPDVSWNLDSNNRILSATGKIFKHSKIGEGKVTGSFGTTFTVEDLQKLGINYVRTTFILKIENQIPVTCILDTYPFTASRRSPTMYTAVHDLKTGVLRCKKNLLGREKTIVNSRTGEVVNCPPIPELDLNEGDNLTIEAIRVERKKLNLTNFFPQGDK